VRSIKEECLSRVILFGEGHLRRCIEQYLEHDHRERNHQGLGNQLIEGPESMGEGDVVCSERLNGLLNSTRELRKPCPGYWVRARSWGRGV